MRSEKVDGAAYEQALKQRGSITFWVSDDAISAWYAEPTGKRGAQLTYSDLAIETSLNIRLIFGQALRQTEGLVESIFKMMSLKL
ncbi:MAG: transposase, partial [Pseudomonadales bacterium]